MFVLKSHLRLPLVVWWSGGRGGSALVFDVSCLPCVLSLFVLCCSALFFFFLGGEEGRGAGEEREEERVLCCLILL